MCRALARRTPGSSRAPLAPDPPWGLELTNSLSQVTRGFVVELVGTGWVSRQPAPPCGVTLGPPAELTARPCFPNSYPAQRGGPIDRDAL